MFKQIFVEKYYATDRRIEKIQQRFPAAHIQWIEKIEDVFGKVKKPYLQKRESLQLFLGRKKGDLIRPAPDAYGISGDPHYYFIHSYNCIYECQYCYLQGYFQSPDIVFFLNHDEICAEIKSTAAKHSAHQIVWFHAGEFSDSLALSHLSGELPLLFKTFSELPQARLELRTKSANIQELKKMDPLPNIYISFSLSPEDTTKKVELKTPALKIRLQAMRELQKRGFQLAIHLDPIIYRHDFEIKYKELILELFNNISANHISYVSLGVVRFTKDVYHQVQKNYPQSAILQQDFMKSFDQKIRYNRPTRMYILNKVKDLLLEQGIPDQNIYLCMEDDTKSNEHAN